MKQSSFASSKSNHKQKEQSRIASKNLAFSSPTELDLVSRNSPRGLTFSFYGRFKPEVLVSWCCELQLSHLKNQDHKISYCRICTCNYTSDQLSLLPTYLFCILQRCFLKLVKSILYNTPTCIDTLRYLYIAQPCPPRQFTIQSQQQPRNPHTPRRATQSPTEDLLATRIRN